MFPLIGDADLVVRVCRSGRVNLRLHSAGSVKSAEGEAVAAVSYSSFVSLRCRALVVTAGGTIALLASERAAGSSCTHADKTQLIGTYPGARRTNCLPIMVFG